SRSSSSPARSMRRNFCRVSASRGCTGSSVEKPIIRGFGSSASSTRSSAASAARSRTFCISCSRVIFTATSASSLTMESTSRPTYPTSVNLVASTLTKGALASRARRRAISVLPTPVGPIIRMFLGVISWRSGSCTCMRRQRLRSAMATARLAASWPMMCLSSSWTISRGVNDDMLVCDASGASSCGVLLAFLDSEMPVRVDADVRLDDIAVAGDHEELAGVADEQQRLQAPQITIGAPVLGELDGGAGQIAVLLQLALEALEEREGVRRTAGEARDHLVVVELAHLARIALHDGVAERHLA